MSAQSLTDHIWENRLVIVFDQSASQSQLMSQQRLLDACADGLSERKIVTYYVTKQSAYAKYGDRLEEVDLDLFERVVSVSEEFETILVGLDGGIKRRYDQPVACNDVFALIDSMPMRQAEIRRQKN